MCCPLLLPLPTNGKVQTSVYGALKIHSYLLFFFFNAFRGKWVKPCQAPVIKHPVLRAIYNCFLCRAVGAMSPCTSLVMDPHMQGGRGRGFMYL